jgi:P4 family phage/plasmid primase-like protien
MLAGKLYNVCAELPEAEIIASEAFKAIVTGDPITGRHIRQAPFTFKPKAGHLFLANDLPGTQDQSRGFWRRFIVIRFNRCFTNDPERDPKIAEKIIASELPWIVAWELEGALRIMTQGSYTIPASHDAELAQWRRNADQIATWLEESTTPAPEGQGVHAAAAYQAYRKWAANNGHRTVSATKFGLRMKALGRAGIKGNRGRIYPFVVGYPRGFGSDGLVTGCDGNPSRDSFGDSDDYN